MFRRNQGRNQASQRGSRGRAGTRSEEGKVKMIATADFSKASVPGGTSDLSDLPDVIREGAKFVVSARVAPFLSRVAKRDTTSARPRPPSRARQQEKRQAKAQEQEKEEQDKEQEKEKQEKEQDKTAQGPSQTQSDRGPATQKVPRPRVKKESGEAGETDS